MLVTLFHLSLAVVQLRDGNLRYRRFLKWSNLHREEVLSSGVVWPPFIGYIRLTHFLFPWGKLYFILDQNVSSNPFYRGDYAVLRYLGGTTIRQEHSSAKLSTAEDRLLKLKLVGTGLVGALVSFVWRIASPRPARRSVLEQPLDPGQPPWNSLPPKLMQLLNHPLVVVAALFVLLILLAMYKRRRPDAWIYSFLAGMALPYFLP